MYWFIPCRILSAIPDDPTAFVDAQFQDAVGVRWTLHDKLAIFRGERGEDVVRVTLESLDRDERGLLYSVSTARPDGVAALGGETEFTVRELGFAAEPLTDWSWLTRVQRDQGFVDVDLLQHPIALALGLLPSGTPFLDAKPHYWSAGGLGDFTANIVWQLQARGELEAEPDDPTRLRWVRRV